MALNAESKRDLVAEARHRALHTTSRVESAGLDELADALEAAQKKLARVEKLSLHYELYGGMDAEEFATELRKNLAEPSEQAGLRWNCAKCGHQQRYHRPYCHDAVEGHECGCAEFVAEPAAPPAPSATRCSEFFEVRDSSGTYIGSTYCAADKGHKGDHCPPQHMTNAPTATRELLATSMQHLRRANEAIPNKGNLAYSIDQLLGASYRSRHARCAMTTPWYVWLAAAPIIIFSVIGLVVCCRGLLK